MVCDNPLYPQNGCMLWGNTASSEGRQKGMGKERGSVANTIYISGRWAHPLLYKWESRGSMKKINSISLFWNIKKVLLASGNGLRGGGRWAANALQVCKHQFTVCKCCFFKAKPAKFPYFWVSSPLTKVCGFCSSISTASWMIDTPYIWEHTSPTTSYTLT